MNLGPGRETTRVYRFSGSGDLPTRLGDFERAARA